MTIQELGALGEAFGALAVVISVVYLAIEVRNNTRQNAESLALNRLESFERSVESANRIRELLILNPDLVDLFIKGCEDFDALAAAERLRFDLLLRNMFAGFQRAFLRQQVVGHDPEHFAGAERLMDSILVNPGVLKWLEHGDKDWHPEFTALVRRRTTASREQSGSGRQA